MQVSNKPGTSCTSVQFQLALKRLTTADGKYDDVVSEPTSMYMVSFSRSSSTTLTQRRTMADTVLLRETVERIDGRMAVVFPCSPLWNVYLQPNDDRSSLVCHVVVG